MEAPLVLWDFEVAPDWVDYNGHMNDAAYALAFSRAGDRWMQQIALGPEERAATGFTLYTLQTMLHYFQEVKLGAPLRVSAQLLEHDGKRARLWMQLHSPLEGPAVAATEQLYLSVRQDFFGRQARAAPWREETLSRLAEMAQAHAGLAVPAQAGKGISLKRA